MSGDDEIAVVFTNNKWYVAHIMGGNIQYAREIGSVFDEEESAMNFAKNISGGTEYGVRVYGKRSGRR